MKINWFFRSKIEIPGIKVGDFVNSNGKYLMIDYWFINGPLKVIGITKGTKKAGGKFVYCETKYKDNNFYEVGFYINGLKKVS